MPSLRKGGAAGSIGKEKLKKHLPRMQFHVFGQCSYWTVIEYKDEFNRLLEDFFGGEL